MKKEDLTRNHFQPASWLAHHIPPYGVTHICQAGRNGGKCGEYAIESRACKPEDYERFDIDGRTQNLYAAVKGDEAAVEAEPTVDPSLADDTEELLAELAGAEARIEELEAEKAGMEDRLAAANREIGMAKKRFNYFGVHAQELRDWWKEAPDLEGDEPSTLYEMMTAATLHDINTNGQLRRKLEELEAEKADLEKMVEAAEGCATANEFAHEEAEAELKKLREAVDQAREQSARRLEQITKLEGWLDKLVDYVRDYVGDVDLVAHLHHAIHGEGDKVWTSVDVEMAEDEMRAGAVEWMLGFADFLDDGKTSMAHTADAACELLEVAPDDLVDRIKELQAETKPDTYESDKVREALGFDAYKAPEQVIRCVEILKQKAEDSDKLRHELESIDAVLGHHPLGELVIESQRARHDLPQWVETFLDVAHERIEELEGDYASLSSAIGVVGEQISQRPIKAKAIAEVAEMMGELCEHLNCDPERLQHRLAELEELPFDAIDAIDAAELTQADQLADPSPLIEAAWDVVEVRMLGRDATTNAIHESLKRLAAALRQYHQGAANA